MTLEAFTNAASTTYSEQSGSTTLPRLTEAEEIINTPKIVSAFGKQYPIARFTLGPALRALEYVGPFGFLIQNIMNLPRNAAGNVTASDEQKIQLAVTAISISGPSALGLISVATGEPPEWLEDKNPVDGLRVLAAVLEKNLDFFSRETIDEVTKMVGGLTSAVLAFSGSTSTT